MNPRDGVDPSLAAKSDGSFAQIVAALSLFVALYLATFFVGRFVSEAAGAFLNQWVALLGVVVATFGTIAILEHRGWDLGIFVPPRFVTREFLIGCGFAILLIGAADGLVLLTTRLHHVAGNGFPWLELMAVYLPAVFHEELLFRGYPFQKVWKSHRIAAILFSSIVFAALHAGNNAFSILAMANLFFAGILLALAYARYERLWFPIGIHLGWNLLSGPILGYNVSGYESSESVLRTTGRGSPWLTGGYFGIEGSVWIVVVELAGIALLLHGRQWIRRPVD
jgi:membrane protease YdiL (CAAX protease family)